MRKISSDEKPPFPPHKMNVFTLVMINVAAMISLSSLPETARYGLSSVFFYLFAVIVFLIPVALVSAELATGWAWPAGRRRWRCWTASKAAAATGAWSPTNPAG